MAIPVIMPKQGQSVESCIISRWFKKKGDTVKAGEPLFSYETDKASFEEEAKVDGVLLEIFYGEGDEVPVLYNVAVIGRVGEAVEAFRQETTIAATPPSPPVAIALFDTDRSSTLSGQQQRRPDSVEDLSASQNPTANSIVVASDAKIKVSPRARVIAKKKGIALAGVKGTGPNGRIIVRDVENLTATAATPAAATESPVQIIKNVPQQPLSVTPVPTVPPVPIVPNVPVAEYSDADCEVRKLTNIRKLIAQAMHQSLQNSAQLTHHLSADARRILAFREEVKKAQKADPSGSPNITLNDMVCWAVVRALEKHPGANSQFLGDSIKTFKKVHLGLAVDTPRGLMVPVLKNADDMSLKGLSNNLRALADACRKGGIDPELLQGAAGSFTVSNLGNYGVEMFTPIINLPQVAILGVNTVIQRPADIGGGVIAFIPFIGLSLTYDHRAIDGGPATLFLKEIKTQIENFNI